MMVWYFGLMVWWFGGLVNSLWSFGGVEILLFQRAVVAPFWLD